LQFTYGENRQNRFSWQNNSSYTVEYGVLDLNFNDIQGNPVSVRNLTENSTVTLTFPNVFNESKNLTFLAIYKERRGKKEKKEGVNYKNLSNNKKLTTLENLLASFGMRG